MSKPRVVIVITPVHADPDFESKMGIVRSACERLGLDCVIPDALPDRFDLDRTIAMMSCADLILADLSFARPSCYYELGLAEGAGAEIALIAKSGTEIFQHSGRSSVEFYSGLPNFEKLVSLLLAKVENLPWPPKRDS